MIHRYDPGKSFFFINLQIDNKIYNSKRRVCLKMVTGKKEKEKCDILTVNIK